MFKIETFIHLGYEAADLIIRGTCCLSIHENTLYQLAIPCISSLYKHDCMFDYKLFMRLLIII